MQRKDASNEVIEFLSFNIDGDGTSIALVDDQLTSYSKKDTLDILIGEKGKECNYTFVRNKDAKWLYFTTQELQAWVVKKPKKDNTPKASTNE